MAVDESLSYAPELVSIVHEEEAVVGEADPEEQVSEEPKEALPVIDEDGVVHLTRTTTKGG